ncbi:MAG: 2TM domain-containing protein [Candidatus Bathyarchaeota archaeon]|nr:2TM domain-containing protein [Candidatus Bathyarchaeota archaeon]
MSSDEQLRQKARERAGAKLSFYIHAAVYAAVNTLLFLIWFFTGGLSTFPWFLFPLVFWGIGLAAHYMTSFTYLGYYDRMTEEEYQRLKKEQEKQH